MNMFSFLFAIIFASSIGAMGARLGGNGNMRGIVTRYSGLSPREAALLRLMLKRKRYGRFGWNAYKSKTLTHRLWVIVSMLKNIVACLNKLKYVSISNNYCQAQNPFGWVRFNDFQDFIGRRPLPIRDYVVLIGDRPMLLNKESPNFWHVIWQLRITL